MKELKSKKINIGTNSVHFKGGDKYADGEEETDDNYIPSTEEGFEFVNEKKDE